MTHNVQQYDSLIPTVILVSKENAKQTDGFILHA